MKHRKLKESLSNINNDNLMSERDSRLMKPLGRRKNKDPIKCVAIYDIRRDHKGEDTNAIYDIERVKIKVYSDNDVQYTYKQADTSIKHDSPLGEEYSNIIKKSIKNKQCLPKFSDIKPEWYDKEYFDNSYNIINKK